VLRWIDRSGEALIAAVRHGLHLIGLLYLSVKVVWTDRDLGQREFLRQILLQVYFTGVQAVVPVVVLGLATGAFAMVRGVGGLGTLSGADNLARIVVLLVLRELAPLLTGGVVIARSVGAVAAELGVMRIQHEIEAIEVMGLSPIRHLVTPRIVGGTLALAALSVIFGVVAVAGGFVAAQLMISLPAGVFLASVLDQIAGADLISFALKTVAGGVGIFLVACFHGLSVERSPSEVPVATSRASLSAFLYLVLLHGAISMSLLLHGTAGPLVRGLL
jgi:phospholipid/cholesterol/gamma-HCH transport system permease protein